MTDSIFRVAQFSDGKPHTLILINGMNTFWCRIEPEDVKNKYLAAGSQAITESQAILIQNAFEYPAELYGSSSLSQEIIGHLVVTSWISGHNHFKLETKS